VDAKAVRAAYQGAADTQEYRDVERQLTTFTRQVSAYGSLRADVGAANPVARLGAAVVSSTADLAGAKAAMERGDAGAADRALEAARSRAGMATWTGAGLVLAALTLLGLAALLVRRLRRRSRAAGPEPAEVLPEGDRSGASEVPVS
jgi:hypothetical protein